MKEGKNKKYKKVNTTTNLKKNKKQKRAVGITASKKILKKKGKNTVLEQEHILILTMKKFMENGLKTVSIKG